LNSSFHPRCRTAMMVLRMMKVAASARASIPTTVSPNGCATGLKC